MASLTTRISKVLQQEFVEGTVYRMDLDRVDVAPDGSSGILRSLPLTGDRDKVKPGDPVKIITVAGERIALAGDVAFSDGESVQVNDVSEIELMESFQALGRAAVQTGTAEGSGADADTLDSYHAANFYLKTDTVANATTAANVAGLTPSSWGANAHLLATDAYGNINVTAIAGSQSTWAKMMRQSNWTIGANGAWVTHPIDGWIEKVPTGFATQFGTNRLVCKVAGAYLITANITFDTNSVGDRGVRLLVNGSEIAMTIQRAMSAAFAMPVNVAMVHWLDIDNFVEVSVFQNSGNANLISKYLPYHSPTLAFARIA